jgi:hypothetical protein
MTGTALRVLDDVGCGYLLLLLAREYYLHHLLLREKTCAALSRLISRPHRER